MSAFNSSLNVFTGPYFSLYDADDCCMERLRVAWSSAMCFANCTRWGATASGSECSATNDRTVASVWLSRSDTGRDCIQEVLEEEAVGSAGLVYQRKSSSFWSGKRCSKLCQRFKFLETFGVCCSFIFSVQPVPTPLVFDAGNSTEQCLLYVSWKITSRPVPLQHTHSHISKYIAACDIAKSRGHKNILLFCLSLVVWDGFGTTIIKLS